MPHSEEELSPYAPFGRGTPYVKGYICVQDALSQTSVSVDSNDTMSG